MHELMGAILAGGMSTRMGRDKATLPLNRIEGGTRMIDVVANALLRVCDSVAVVHSALTPTADLPRQPGGRDLPNVFDLRPHAGPLGGIEALLASNLSREYIVCPCDVPCITSDILRMLLRHRDAPATVLRILGEVEPESLPARIAADALPAVRRLLDGGQRSVWRLMQQLPAAIVEIDAHYAASLRNINTPEDFNTI